MLKKRTFFFVAVLFLSFALRVYQLGVNPPSLYWDEASLGYNAYSVSQSGRDEHGELLPLARFIAFGDYKPPGYIYAAVLPVIVSGLNEISVRIPSVVAGLGIVLFAYFLTRELFHKEKLSLTALFIAGISPWGIHFSRAAFEANLAAFFNLMGIYFFVLSLRKKSMIVLSVIFFSFSFYTFNANRIISPLIFAALIIIYFRDIWLNKKWLLLSTAVGILFLLPSLSYLNSRESRLRFQEVSIFNNLEPLKLSNQLINDDGNTILSKIIHNRRISYTLDFLKHYSDNFNPRFLFTHGDVNPRLNDQSMGQLFVYEAPFLLIGLYSLFKSKKKSLLMIIAWMLVSVIPAGTAKETPHALRIISILPSYQIIIAIGIINFFLWVKNILKIRNFQISVMAFSIIILANIFYYLHNYYTHFPINWSGEWQYGYKQMVRFVLERINSYDNIYVTSSLGRPYIFFAFYKPYGVDSFMKERISDRDWFGFWEVKSLGKINFDFSSLSNAPGKILTVTTDKNITPGFRIIKIIKNLGNEDVFYITEKI